MTLNGSYSTKFGAAFYTSRLIIVARWREEQDFSMELPAEVLWGDGSAATLETSRTIAFTPTFLDKGEWIEQHIFRDILAEVYFDQKTGFWSLRGRGVHPAAYGTH